MGPHERPTRYFLVESAYAKSTMVRYEKAARDFLEWIINNNYDAFSSDDMDALLVEYLHDLYMAGRGKQTANNTVFGLLVFLPSLRRHLHSARLCLRGWEKLHPSVAYPPLTWELAVVISIQMLRRRRRAEAVATLLGFDCYLRLSEICGLHVADVVNSGDVRLGGAYRGVALRLRTTKTGNNQWVEVGDAAVRRLVLALRDGAVGELVFFCEFLPAIVQGCLCGAGFVFDLRSTLTSARWRNS